MVDSAPLINKFVVVGMGLIGGSLATGLKLRGACREVIGIGRTAETCAEAIAHKVVDRAYVSLTDIAAELGAGRHDVRPGRLSFLEGNGLTGSLAIDTDLQVDLSGAFQPEMAARFSSSCGAG